MHTFELRVRTIRFKIAAFGYRIVGIIRILEARGKSFIFKIVF